MMEFAENKHNNVKLGDFLYTCDYDVNVVVERLKEDDTFKVEDDPFSKELESTTILSSYIKIGGNGEAELHLVVED